MKEYLKSASDDIYSSKQIRFAIVYNGETISEAETIGYIDLFDFDPSHRRAGVGILIGSKLHRGKGLAKEALRLMEHYAFSILGLHQIHCIIHRDNMRSIKLFTSAGYRKAGTLTDWTLISGEWRTVDVFQKLNSN
jgi:diamine N-acetyltransferase